MSVRPALSWRPEQAGRAGLVATGASVALTFVVGVSGISLMEPPYPGRPGQPPWAFSAHLSPYLAVALTGLSLAAATIGLALTVSAMRRGWAISARHLLLAGIAAAAVLTLLPPFGSSDPLSYAAYGRMLVTGHNPYAIGPDVLARLGDPVARAVQDWKTTPSDYGTVATAGQAIASLLGGTSARLTVFILSLLNLAAFAGTAVLLHRMGRGDRVRQARAAVLWTCNPLLLQVLVAGEHVDSQAVVFGVAAVAVFSPVVAGPISAGSVSAGSVSAGRVRGLRSLALRAAAAGALAGLGFAVKVTIALIGAGLAVAAVQAFWPRARAAAAGWRSLAAVASGLAAGFVVTAGAALAAGGRDGFRQTVQASSMVSFASPWRGIRAALGVALGHATADDIVKTLAVVLAVVLAVLLLRGLPGGSPAGPAGGTDPAGRAALAFALAWLLAWPYLLPWYDALAWALLPLVAASSLDWLLLARTAALAFGYLPARSAGVVIPAGLGWLQTVVRKGLTPAVLAVVVIWLIVSLVRGRVRPSAPTGVSTSSAAGGPGVTAEAVGPRPPGNGRMAR